MKYIFSCSTCGHLFEAICGRSDYWTNLVYWLQHGAESWLVADIAGYQIRIVTCCGETFWRLYDKAQILPIKLYSLQKACSLGLLSYLFAL